MFANEWDYIVAFRLELTVVVVIRWGWGRHCREFVTCFWMFCLSFVDFEFRAHSAYSKYEPAFPQLYLHYRCIEAVL